MAAHASLNASVVKIQHQNTSSLYLSQSVSCVAPFIPVVVALSGAFTAKKEVT